MRRSSMLALLLTLMAGTAQATGPSTAEADLFPLAARNGAVLFRTRWQVNTTGGSGFQRTEFGWLVVTARGWEEVPHRVLAPDERAEGPWDELMRLNEEFKKPLDWDKPPESLSGLLRRYGFTRKDAVEPEVGKGTVRWTPKALCQGARCGAPCRQRGLRGLRSVAESAVPVEASFVHSGLALFHNQVTDPDTEPQLGARFAESQPGRGRDFANVEYQSASGICRLPR